MEPSSKLLYDDIQIAVDLIIKKYSKGVEDGKLTFAETWTLFQNGIATLVQLAQKYQGYTGEQKKEAVLEALGRLYDEVIAPIDLKGIPNFLEGIVDGALRQLMMTFASPAIDSMVNVFNKTGWGSGDQTPTAVPESGPQGPQGTPSGFTPY